MHSKSSVSDHYFTRTTDYYNLAVLLTPKSTAVTMQLRTSIVNTREIPLTYSILRDFLPSILVCECFNDSKTPFCEEVKQTEIGHLFEHIVLEYLCELKLATGLEKAEYSGVTNWNWKKDPWGTFHITLDANATESAIIIVAIEKAIQLVNLILRSALYTPRYPWGKPLLRGELENQRAAQSYT